MWIRDTVKLDKQLPEPYRVVTPRGRPPGQENDAQSLSVAGSAQEAVIAALEERLRRMEQGGQHGANSSDGLMAGAIVKQTEMMEKMLTQKQPESRRGVIRIDPTEQWPILHSEDLDVDDFTKSLIVSAD